MIDETIEVFPNNVVSVLKARLDLIDPDIIVLRRPLRTSDPLQAIGVTAAQWLPDEESYEMKNGPVGRHEPSLQTYLITIQALVKDGDEERGLAVHAVLSKIIRSMLYRDDPLRVALSSLTTTLNGSTELTQRWGIRQQRYFSNEIKGAWLYLSNLEFWLETETR